MKGKRVFVSGGAGVIGLEMIPKLLALGAIVMVGDLKSRPLSFAPEVHYRQGDLNLMSQLELDTFAPEIFIHLAATFERSAESYGFWEENFSHNVKLSHYLMTLVKDLPSIKRVVFASSYLIYSPDLYQFNHAQTVATKLKESDPILPRNLTGMAKLAHEIELRFIDEFRSTNFSTVSARIYRGYGKNSRDVISRWVRALLAGEKITLYRPEGMFDYIYAKDTAEGLIRLARAQHVKGIINLGTGRARRVQDVVDVLRHHFPSMELSVEPSALLFEASEADVSKYKSEIGWLPEYDLERAIPEIIEYERARSGQTLEQKSAGNVLITSAAKKVSLVRAVKQAAQKISLGIRVIAADLNPDALTQYVADQFWVMPRTVDSELEALLEGCHRQNIKIIIPTRDGELMFWAKHKELFKKYGIRVVVSDLESIKVCFDKLLFASFGVKNKMPFIPAALNPDEITAQSYVVKERFGAGALKIGINLSAQDIAAHAKLLEAPIFQPYVAGREISVDAWLDKNHQVKGLVMRTRDLVVNGESQVTSTFRDVAIQAQLEHVLVALKLTGPVVLQVMIDDAGAIHIIECNTRFGGASTTAIAAGLDVFYWTLLEAMDVDLTEYPFQRVPGEVKQIRVPQDLYVFSSDI